MVRLCLLISETDFFQVTRQIKKNLTKESGLDLKFTGPQGVEYTLKNVDDRDQAFSQIIGYSPVKWQVVW
jgi:hypothetical protein